MSALSDKAYDYILQKIMKFEYLPDDPIIESDIASSLNISRTPLREALQRLEAEGFVIKAANRGTFVKSYTKEDIAESCEIRKMFELHALKNCVEYVTEDEVKQVRALLLGLKETDAPEKYYESDKALHNMITRYCMNSKMRSILKSLQVQLDGIQQISAKTPNRLKKSCEEHLAILSAIDARDYEEAEKLLRVHLQNVEESCIQAFLRMRMDKIGNR